MTDKQRLAKTWNIIENLFFLGFAVTIISITISSFFNGTWKSLSGSGFLADITDPVNKKIYYQAAIAILAILTTFFLLTEMVKLFIKFNPFRNFSAKLPALKEELAPLGFIQQLGVLFKKAGNTQFVKEGLRRYKTNFLAKVFNEYISKLFIIFVYIEMMPYFVKFALFTVPNTWYGWLYAYLMWELTYWIWHYLGHRVRLFWCLHSPHHAPVEMNLTVAWVHFFAEGYYTAAIQVPLLMLFGVTPEMVAIILVIDGTWGTFIHAGEDAFKDGRLGILERFLITPSHSLNKARLLKIGMSKNDVVNLIGTPKRIEVSIDTEIQYEYWHYQGKISRDPYVCFINDKVQSWHDM